jgi:hypothetical protein
MREGRFGYHVGDTTEVGDVDAFDTTYFAVAIPAVGEGEGKDTKVAADLAELDKLDEETEATTPKATKPAVKTTADKE